MPSYEHNQIAQAINILEHNTDQESQSNSWLRAEGHLNLLRQNAESNEVILYAVSRTSFIHAVITKESDVRPADHNDLLEWDSSPFRGRAGYSWTLGSGTVQMEFSETNPRPRTMKHSQNLVFGRRMEGLDEPDDYELLQEFAHATGILWRDDQRAYCCIDENGDFDPIVSITKSVDRTKATLITCQLEPLEQYMAATGTYPCTLLRLHDGPTRRVSFMARGSDRQEGRVRPLFLQSVHTPGWARLDQRNADTARNDGKGPTVPIHHRIPLPKD